MSLLIRNGTAPPRGGQAVTTHREPGRWGVAVAEVVTLEVVGDESQCRQAGLAAAFADVSAALAARDEPVLALRCYQPGGLVVALGGRFDHAAVDRLRGRVEELRARAHRELVVECSRLDPCCGRRLARVLAHLRVQCLVGGARVELHHAPAELLAVLGQARCEAFTVTDTDTGVGVGAQHRGWRS